MRASQCQAERTGCGGTLTQLVLTAVSTSVCRPSQHEADRLTLRGETQGKNSGGDSRPRRGTKAQCSRYAVYEFVLTCGKRLWGRVVFGQPQQQQRSGRTYYKSSDAKQADHWSLSKAALSHGACTGSSKGPSSALTGQCVPGELCR